MKYGNKSLWKKIVKSPVIFVALSIMFIFVARATWKMYEKASLSNERLSQAVATLAELNSHNNMLSEKVAYLSTEQGIESEIRTKFRVAQEGESVAVIVGDTQSGGIMNQASLTPVSLSWWRRLLRVFGF
ncbi:MAG: hypothetical protein AAB629_01625 [Patescibacteria group bacterium]